MELIKIINMTTQENQTENMEAQTTESLEKSAIRSVLVRLIPGASEWALKIIRHNNISYALLGTDQHDTTILQLSYAAEQQKDVNDLFAFLNFFESLVQALQPAYEVFLEEMQKSFYKLKAERRQTKKIETVKLINSLSHGTKAGK